MGLFRNDSLNRRVKWNGLMHAACAMSFSLK